MSPLRRLVRPHRMNTAEILFLGVMAVVSIQLSRYTLRIRRVPDYAIKLTAVQRTLQAYETIQEEVRRRGIPVDTLTDPMGLGLVGPQTSPITTTLGNYEAKLTSVNPNWAAVVLEELKRAGVHPGDGVALSLTGSFPALNIAVLVALETYGVKPYWVTSVGSSSWGATRPDLTWLDMYALLHRRGLIQSRPLFCSLGGNNDVAAGLPPASRDLLRRAILRNRCTLLELLPLERAAQTAWEAMRNEARVDHVPIRAYINVGGGILSFGTTHTAQVLRPGLNHPRILLNLEEEPVRGLVAMALTDGLPVINFLDLRVLAYRYGLPIAPAALPVPGMGPLFYAPRYDLFWNTLILVGYLVLLGLVVGGWLGGIFGNPRSREDWV